MNKGGRGGEELEGVGGSCNSIDLNVDRLVIIFFKKIIFNK